MLVHQLVLRRNKCGCRNSKVHNSEGINALLNFRNQFCSPIGKCALAYYDAHKYPTHKSY